MKSLWNICIPIGVTTEKPCRASRVGREMQDEYTKRRLDLAVEGQENDIFDREITTSITRDGNVQ
jgi:hypothetical protein